MSGIVVLSTDTPHHRYFINFLEQAGVPLAAYLFETKLAAPSFPVGPVFEEQEHAFEMAEFFRHVSSELDVKKLQLCESVGGFRAIELLEQLKPDFGVVFGTGKLPKKVIGMFRYGIINVHRGMSEGYRGLDSDLWAIYHGDYNSLGVTIHRVDESLDTGNVISHEQMALLPGMRVWQIRYYTTLIATRLVHHALKDYLSGSLKDRRQLAVGRYYSFMPLELKKVVAEKFNRYCDQLRAHIVA